VKNYGKRLQPQLIQDTKEIAWSKATRQGHWAFCFGDQAWDKGNINF